MRLTSLPPFWTMSLNILFFWGGSTPQNAQKPQKPDPIGHFGDKLNKNKCTQILRRLLNILCAGPNNVRLAGAVSTKLDSQLKRSDCEIRENIRKGFFFFLTLILYFQLLKSLFGLFQFFAFFLLWVMRSIPELQFFS